MLILPIQPIEQPFSLNQALTTLNLPLDLPEDQLWQRLVAMSPPEWITSSELLSVTTQDRLAVLAYNLAESKRLNFHLANNRAQQLSRSSTEFDS